MRNVFVLNILIGIWPNLFSQQPTFNFVNDYGYLTYSFEDMVVADDTIVGIGSAYPDSFNLTQGIVLTQLDSNGVVIKTRMYFDSLGRNLAVPSDGSRIIKTGDGGYAFVVSSTFDNDAFLYKVDRNFDIEFIKTYSDSVYISNFPYRILETKSGYLLTGFNQKTNYQLFSFVRHVDKLGNIIWEKKYFQNGEDNYVLDAKPINDSIFAVTSIVLIDDDKFDLYSIIRVLDINGNQTGYWEGQVDDEVGGIMEILPFKDGGFITYGHRKYVWEQFNKLVQQAFVKFSSDFEVEWIRHWYKPASQNGQRDLRSYLFSPEGNIIGVGGGAETIQGVLRSTANIIKFSTTGDSIWNRVITRPSPLDTQNAYCDINAGGILSSGSIIAGGQVIRAANNAYYAWVIKITNDGCLDTLFSCTTRVREYNSQGQLGIFPNPVDVFAVLKLTPSSSIQYLTITDFQGRQIFQTVVPNETENVEIYTGDFPNGLYFINIAGNGMKYSGKLSVLHR
jgi:Secretion system C-terminal sorting domain